MDDIGFSFPRAVIPQVVEQDALQISFVNVLFRLDSTTQEENETFTLSFTPPVGALVEPILRDELQGVIVDATSKKHQSVFCKHMLLFFLKV